LIAKDKPFLERLGRNALQVMAKLWSYGIQLALLA